MIVLVKNFLKNFFFLFTMSETWLSSPVLLCANYCNFYLTVSLNSNGLTWFKIFKKVKINHFFICVYLGCCFGIFTFFLYSTQNICDFSFKHWMLSLGCRRSYNTPGRAYIFNTASLRVMIICLHSLVCYKTDDI